MIGESVASMDRAVPVAIFHSHTSLPTAAATRVPSGLKVIPSTAASLLLSLGRLALSGACDAPVARFHSCPMLLLLPQATSLLSGLKATLEQPPSTAWRVEGASDALI